MAAAVTARRKAAGHPLAAMDAAKAAVAAKAERAPETLTAEDLQLLRGAKILELGNAGRLRHLGLGVPLRKATTPAAAPKMTASKSPRALTDEDLAKMTGAEISAAMGAGRVAGIRAPRRPRRR